MATANKTQQTTRSVDAYVAKVKPPAKREDCATLRAIMTRVAGEDARMWGPSIVGFGVRKYRYESGREGEICRIGFAARAQALTIYGLDVAGKADAIAALGKTTTGKGCVYVKRLADIDLKKLETLLRAAVR